MLKGDTSPETEHEIREGLKDPGSLVSRIAAHYSELSRLYWSGEGPLVGFPIGRVETNESGVEEEDVEAYVYGKELPAEILAAIEYELTIPNSLTTVLFKHFMNQRRMEDGREQ